MSKDKNAMNDKRKKDAKWESGKTSMSNLTKEERRKRLGLLPSEEELYRMKKKEE